MSPRLLVLAVVLCAFTGCFKKETPVDAALDTKTLLLGNGAEPRDLDPHLLVTFNDYNIAVALFEGLTVLDEATSEPRPGMAERWDISEDGLVYTFHLRTDATWSNGEPLTAADFAFSFERALSPKLGSEYANILYPIRGAEAYNSGKTTDFAQVGVEAVDARTLRITLERPTPYVLSLAAHPEWFPVHAATLRKHGDIYQRGTPWTRPGNLVGNGPFVLTEWKADDRVVVTKNPRHHDAATNQLERVIFFPVANPGVDENNFRAGQVHVTYDVLPDRLDAWRREAPDRLRIDPFLETFYVRFNVTRAPFTDKRVRQALARAIDRAAIAGPVMRDSRTPAHALVPPDTAGYNSTAQVPTDFDAARKLLAEAGYPEGKGFPKVSLKMNADPINSKVFEAIQQMWRKELGIEVNLSSEEFGVYIGSMQTLDFELLRSRWVADYNDPSTFTDMFTSTSGNNNTGWKNPAYDELVSRASGEQDNARRFALLQEAEAILLDEAPIAPVFFGARTYLLHPDVKGWTPSLLGVHRYQTLRLER